MAVTLICPKCQNGTELRGTLDAYYLTWCPECERLWRFELWTLVHGTEQKSKRPWLTSREGPRRRHRARPPASARLRPDTSRTLAATPRRQPPLSSVLPPSLCAYTPAPRRSSRGSAAPPGDRR